MRLARRHWACALCGAVLVHAGVAVAVLWQAPEAGAVNTGIGGIEVSLGPAGSAPGSVARPLEADTDAASAVPEAVTAVPPREHTASSVPRPRAVESVPIMQAPALDAQVLPEPVPDETVTLAAVEQVLAAPVTPPPRRKPERKPDPKRKPEPKQRAAVAPRPAVAAAPVAAIEASAAGAGGKADTQASPDAGSAEASSGGGQPGADADYFARLQAWLEKHKEYPRTARLRRQQGTALLMFVIDREGRVLDYRLQRSSGHSLLDREVQAMIERSQPLPRIPDEMHQTRLELVVPVQFFLR
jgi:protein TonB